MITDDMDEETKMRIMMGFGGFDSTKGKKVAGTKVGVASVAPKQRKFRQFMNRQRKAEDLANA